MLHRCLALGLLAVIQRSWMGSTQSLDLVVNAQSGRAHGFKDAYLVSVLPDMLASALLADRSC